MKIVLRTLLVVVVVGAVSFGVWQIVDLRGEVDALRSEVKRYERNAQYVQDSIEEQMEWYSTDSQTEALRDRIEDVELGLWAVTDWIEQNF